MLAGYYALKFYVLTKMKTSKPLQEKSAEGAVTGPDTALPELIRLANMLPADKELPFFPDAKFLEASGGTSGFWNDAIYGREFVRFLDENFPRERFGEFRQFLDPETANPLRREERYIFVTESREYLRMIARHQKARSLFTLTLYFPWEQIGGWQVDRIRMCENCGKLFIANRNNKLTCSDPCSTARRVREWRKHQLQYQQARKKKSALTTKSSRTKTQKQKTRSSRRQGSQGGENGTQKAR